MNSDRYLDDWFIADEVIDQIGAAEYEVYMQECFEEGGQY